MSARQKIIHQPACLYRVGKRQGGDGLWYDAEGRETGLIRTLSDGASKDLPMGPDPIFRADGRAWISCTRRLEDLLQWFSAKDFEELFARGYEILEVTVLGYRRFFFDGFSHEVYCAQQALAINTVEPEEFSLLMEIAA